MAAGSFWHFSLAAGSWAPGAAVESVRVCLRSAPAQSGPGGEELVRKKAREEGGDVERNCPPSHGNERPGLASPGWCPAHSSWHLRSSLRGWVRKQV